MKYLCYGYIFGLFQSLLVLSTAKNTKAMGKIIKYNYIATIEYYCVLCRDFNTNYGL